MARSNPHYNTRKLGFIYYGKMIILGLQGLSTLSTVCKALRDEAVWLQVEMFNHHISCLIILMRIRKAEPEWSRIWGTDAESSR